MWSVSPSRNSTCALQCLLRLRREHSVSAIHASVTMATNEAALARRSKAGLIDHFLYPVGDHSKISILLHSFLLLATSSAAVIVDCSLLRACVNTHASDGSLGLV